MTKGKAEDDEDEEDDLEDEVGSVLNSLPTEEEVAAKKRASAKEARKPPAKKAKAEPVSKPKNILNEGDVKLIPRSTRKADCDEDSIPEEEDEEVYEEGEFLDYDGEVLDDYEEETYGDEDFLFLLDGES